MSTLPTQIEQAIEQYIESIDEHLTARIDEEYKDNSDMLWYYFENIGENLDYSDGQFLDVINKQIDLCDGIVTIPSTITTDELIAKCRELLEFSPELYCCAVANDSYYSHKDSIISLSVGELEYSLPDEFEADDLPEFIADKINRTTNYTYNRGYFYATLLAVELRLVKPVHLITDAIEALTEEQ